MKAPTQLEANPNKLQLDEAKNNLKIVTEEIIKNPENNEISDLIISRRNDVKTCVLSNNYTEAIHHLQILRDLEAGIRVEELDNNLIRDARGAGEFLTKTAYQIQFLNMVRSAKTLIELNNVNEKAKTNLDTKLDAIAKYFYGEVLNIRNEKEQQKFLLEHNEILIENLAKALNQPKNTLSKDLQLAMDYANFEDQHHNISTISKIGDKIIVQSDVAILGTTDAQKKYFQNLYDYSRTEPKTPFAELKTKTDLPEFFINLSELEQKLVYRNIDALYHGSKVHNTQLRNIPGAKNAYNYSVALWNGEELKEKLSELRIGTIYCTNQCKDKDEISKTSLEQLNKAIGKRIHFNSLVTPMPYPPEDRNVFNAANKATRITGNLHTNVALNKFRALSNNYYDGLEEILKDIGFSISQHKINSNNVSLENIGNYLKTPQNLFSKEYILGENELESLSKEQQNLVQDLLKLKKLISSYKGIEVNDNKGLTEINALASKIISTAKNYKFGTTEGLLSDVINVISCKSGKDRTGMQALVNSTKILEAEFEGKPLSNIAEELAKTGHLQISSAKQGGRQGCFGILPGTGAAFPKEYEKSRELLALETAKFNKDKSSLIKDYKKVQSHKIFKWEEETDKIEYSKKTETLKDDSKHLNLGDLKLNTKESPAETQPASRIKTEPLTLSKDYSKRFEEIAKIKHKDELEPKLQEFVADVKKDLKPVEINKEETSKDQATFGNKNIGTISIITNKDGTYSFETKPSENGKGINCLYPIPRAGAEGHFDMLKFENGNLVGVIESTKGISKLNKENIQKLQKTYNTKKIANEIPKPLMDNFSGTNIEDTNRINPPTNLTGQPNSSHTPKVVH